jgi:lysyl-tRNA synthetase class 2
MKPESLGIHSEDKSEESISVELTDEETLVLKLLKEKSPTDLNELKGKAGLSNKKWDTAIKGLTKNGIAKVEKNEEGLWVSVV